MTDTAKTSKSTVLMPEPQHTMLGQATTYHDTYDASLLTPIPRKLGRDAIGRHDFQGHDYWHLFEVTWLSPNGLPQVAAGLMTVPATTECIVESKSLKLYVGSFTQSVFPSKEAVEARMTEDLVKLLGEGVRMELTLLSDWQGDAMLPTPLPGIRLEALPEMKDATFDAFEVDPDLLAVAEDAGGEIVEEVFSTELFRSCCPVTGQPDHAGVVIRMKGPKADRAGLLKYLVSYRCHRGFHEQCVEQIFTDLSNVFSPEILEVHALFTRRGGIDISPFRSNVRSTPDTVLRSPRQ